MRGSRGCRRGVGWVTTPLENEKSLNLQYASDPPPPSLSRQTQLSFGYYFIIIITILSRYTHFAQVCGETLCKTRKQ